MCTRGWKCHGDAGGEHHDRRHGRARFEYRGPVSLGSYILMVTQPWLPCQKLAAKFGVADVGKRMTAGGRTGFYLSVVREGEVAAGDTIELVHRCQNSIKVADVVLLHTTEKANRVLLHRAIETEALPESWRAHFARKLAGLEKDR